MHSRTHALTLNHPHTLSAPDGHRVGTMNLAMRDSSAYIKQWQRTTEVQPTNDTHCLGLKDELWDTYVQITMVHETQPCSAYWCLSLINIHGTKACWEDDRIVFAVRII